MSDNQQRRKPRNGRRRPKSGACFVCGALDHQKANCPQRPQAQNGQPNPANRNTNTKAQRRKKKPEPAESSPRKSKQPVRQPDNLKRIEGVGPKIAEVLRSSGITTFEKLAGMTPDQIKAVLTAAGDRFSFQDPTTWPAQADLAAKGKWDELKKWQEDLKGGKIVAPETAKEEAPEEEAPTAEAKNEEE
mgnify:CR=1 FL=1